MKHLMSKLNYRQLESYLFYIVLGVNLLPILTGCFFPTLDGAAHLYNAELIRQLLLAESGPLSDYFILNPEPVPNWTGHFILVVIKSFTPGFIAEKALLLFYLIGLPLVFRAIINESDKSNVLGSYLIFPFTYSFPFFLGFYNFCIAVLFLFLTILFWARHQDKIHRPMRLLQLGALITLTYFSHIFVFGILVFILALQIGLQATIKIWKEDEMISQAAKSSLKRYGLLTLVSALPLILFVYYFYTRPTGDNKTFLPWQELLAGMKNIRPIIALNFEIEEVHTKRVLYVMITITIAALWLRLRNLVDLWKESLHNLPNTLLHSIRPTDSWILASLVMLILYFILPDSDGQAGYVSVRLCLLFFLFFIAWLSTHEVPRWLGFVSVALVLYSHFRLNQYYTETAKALNKVASECYAASEFIEPNSVVLPVNFSDNWIQNHFSNYLGADKPMLLLENYECATGYFPVKWNEQRIPRFTLGSIPLEDLDCLENRGNNQNEEKQIDYVFTLGSTPEKPNACIHLFDSIVKQQYTLVYSSTNCALYASEDMRAQEESLSK